MMELIEQLENEPLINVTELGIDADEEALGVVQIIAMRKLTLTVLVCVHESGATSYGASYSNRDVIARATARERAIDNLKRSRTRFEQISREREHADGC